MSYSQTTQTEPWTEPYEIASEIINTGNEIVSHCNKWKILDFKPKKKQAEFFAASKTHNEIYFMAMNQGGKSYGAAAGHVVQAAGLYEECPWYGGRVWNKPITIIVASHTSEFVRDTMQLLLCGEFITEDERRAVLSGEGLIPGELITRYTRKKAPSDCIDTIWIKHKSGGTSKIIFKSYDQGYLKFAGRTVHKVHLDEDSCTGDSLIIGECKKRVMVNDGTLEFTLTATKGVTPTVDRCYPEPDKPNRKLIMFGINDDETLSEKKRQEILAETEEDEIDCRCYGHPMQGEGKVFKVNQDLYTYDPRQKLPYGCLYGKAFDFGWNNHACVWMAYHVISKVIYIFAEYQEGEMVIALHALNIKQREKLFLGEEADLITAYGHDNTHNEVNALKRADIWRQNGIRMMDKTASYTLDKEDLKGKVTQISDITKKTWIEEARERMAKGTLKISKNCVVLLQQLKFYHRKNGKIVDENDHLIDAMAKGLMTKDQFEPLISNFKKGVSSFERDFDCMAV